MKEEIEKRRAEAAEKRQKVEDYVDGETKKPFKCVSPRGSSLKVSRHPLCLCPQLSITRQCQLTRRNTLSP